MSSGHQLTFSSCGEPLLPKIEPNKVTRLIINVLSILIFLDLVRFIDLLNMSPDLLMQFLHLLSSLFSLKTDFATSWQWDEITRSKRIDPIECLKGRTPSSSNRCPVVYKFRVWEPDIHLSQVSLN